MLTAERDIFAPDDDKENEIANAGSIPNWSIFLLPDSASIAPGTTISIAATLYRNDQAQSGGAFFWHSADNQIATVDNGVVTAVGIGETTITAAWQKHPTIFTTATIAVEEAPPQVVEYKFYSVYEDGSEKSYTDFDIMQSNTRVFGIEKWINGVVAQENDSYAFAFNPNGATATNYTYTVLNSYSVKIKNNRVYANPVSLSGTSNESGEVLTISFRLRALF